MKKTMMILALLLMVVTLSAQTGVKISAKYKKGDNMLYRQTSTINVGGKDIHVSGREGSHLLLEDRVHQRIRMGLRKSGL